LLDMLQYDGPEKYFPDSSIPQLDAYYADKAAHQLDVPMDTSATAMKYQTTPNLSRGVSIPNEGGYGNQLFVAPRIQRGPVEGADRNQMNTMLHEGSHIANFDRGNYKDSRLNIPEERATRMLDRLRSPADYNPAVLKEHGIDPTQPFDTPKYRNLVSREYLNMMEDGYE